MRWWFAVGYTIALSTFLPGRLSATKSCNCFVNHPQEMLCNADFAFVGTVLMSEDKGEAFVYDVEISDGLVFKGMSYIEEGTKLIKVYTPYGTKLCGRTSLHAETYLFTGDFLEGIFEMTYCNWVQLWDEITIQQKEFLARLDYLKHCKTCTIYGVKSSLKPKIAGNDLQTVSGMWTTKGCLFNPVASGEVQHKDCETSYSFCHMTGPNQCDWRVTPEYEDCFNSRERAWARVEDPDKAAAMTRVEDCKKLPTRRKKKNCLRLVKERIKSKRIQPTEMLEELLDLRELWLEDDLFDDGEY